MLEQIVKENVPFAGVWGSAGFDEKSRIVIPKPLVITFKERQKVNEKGGIKLFYRIHRKESPIYIEFADYLGRFTNFARYAHISIDEQSRAIVPVEDLAKIGLEKTEKPNPVVFVGSGNKILVYKAEDYEMLKTRSYLSLETALNLFARISERFSLPEIR